MVWWAEHFGEVGVRNFEAEEREGEETEQKTEQKKKRETRERERVCVCDFRVLERERERERQERAFEMVIACEEEKKDSVIYELKCWPLWCVGGPPDGYLISGI